MAKKKESFFWTSYSDLMTSLFFIMLVMFVLVIVLLYKRMEVTQNQLDDIKKVVNSTKDLKNSQYFEYIDKYKKYVLNIPVTFPAGISDINRINVEDKEECLDKLYEAGNEISQFLEIHKDYQYLLIIEGQASLDSYSMNYQLSYERALSLMKFWNSKGLSFGENCEIQISGSGDGKIDTKSPREKEEPKNQRFLIHVLPKNIIKDNQEHVEI